MNETTKAPEPIPGSSVESPFYIITTATDSLPGGMEKQFENIHDALEKLPEKIIYIQTSIGVLKADFTKPYVSARLETLTQKQTNMTAEQTNSLMSYYNGLFTGALQIGLERYQSKKTT